jgi:hypothetical protein
LPSSSANPAGYLNPSFIIRKVYAREAVLSQTEIDKEKLGSKLEVAKSGDLASLLRLPMASEVGLKGKSQFCSKTPPSQQ